MAHGSPTSYTSASGNKKMSKTDAFTRASSYDDSFEYVSFPPEKSSSPMPEDCFIDRSNGPLTKHQVEEYIDQDGRLVNEHALRRAVFKGGISNEIRKEVWGLLFGLYPFTSTYREREVLLADYHVRYNALKERWKEELQRKTGNGDVLDAPYCTPDLKTDPSQCKSSSNRVLRLTSEEANQQLEYLKIQGKVYAGRQALDIDALIPSIRIVNKDVPRTDRDINYFAGNENPNMVVLRDILVTFSAYHPQVGYAQGMNDIVSRFLVTFDSEVEAYWCFTKYMENIQKDFTEEGMLRKVHLVRQLLTELDPDLYKYLAHCDMGDLMVCHRWLLLTFKREFNFQDALRCFEILSSHHLELSSMEAERAREDGRRKEFEQQGGKSRIEEAPVNTEFTFELFLCVAILIEYRDKLFKCADATDIFQCINGLTQQIKLDYILGRAEALFYQYCRKSAVDCFQVVDLPGTPKHKNTKNKNLLYQELEEL